MTSKELTKRLAEIQVALLCDFGKPEGLSERSRKNACNLVAELKREVSALTPADGSTGSCVTGKRERERS